jgi:hypothetical protein
MPEETAADAAQSLDSVSIVAGRRNGLSVYT